MYIIYKTYTSVYVFAYIVLKTKTKFNNFHLETLTANLNQFAQINFQVKYASRSPKYY